MNKFNWRLDLNRLHILNLVSFLKRVSLAALINGAAQVIAIILFINLAQLLDHQEFGRLAFLLLISNIFGSFAFLKFENSILNEHKSELNILIICIFISAINSVVLIAILISVGINFSIKITNLNEILLICLNGFFQALNQFFILYYGRNNNNLITSLSALSKQIVVFLSTYIFWNKLDYISILLLYNLANVIVFLFYARVRLNYTKIPMLELVIKHRPTVSYGLLTALIDSGEQFFLPLIVSAQVSQSDFGIFRLSYMLMRGPVGIVGGAFSAPFIWLFRNKTELRLLAVNFVILCAVMAAGVSYFLAYIAVVIPVFYHLEPYFSTLRGLTPWLFTLFCVSPLTLIPVAIGRQRMMMAFAVLDCVAVLGGASIFLPMWGLRGIFPLSMVMALCLALEWLWIRKLIKAGPV